MVILISILDNVVLTHHLANVCPLCASVVPSVCGNVGEYCGMVSSLMLTFRFKVIEMSTHERYLCSTTFLRSSVIKLYGYSYNSFLISGGSIAVSWPWGTANFFNCKFYTDVAFLS